MVVLQNAGVATYRGVNNLSSNKHSIQIDYTKKQIIGILTLWKYRKLEGVLS